MTRLFKILGGILLVVLSFSAGTLAVDHPVETEQVRKPVSKEISGVLSPGESITGKHPGVCGFLGRTAPAGKWIIYRVRVHGVILDADPNL